MPKIMPNIFARLNAGLNFYISNKFYFDINIQLYIILYLLCTYHYCIYMFFLTIGYIDL